MNRRSPVDISVSGVPDALERAVRRVIDETIERWGESHALAGGGAWIDVAVVGDRPMARLNWQWLAHRGPTDVITFPLSEPGCWPVEGQIVVSIDTARREARRRGHAWELELLRYVAHGLLHLLGFDDATAAERARMNMIETMLLRLAGVDALYDAGKRAAKRKTRTTRAARPPRTPTRRS